MSEFSTAYSSDYEPVDVVAPPAPPSASTTSTRLAITNCTVIVLRGADTTGMLSEARDEASATKTVVGRYPGALDVGASGARYAADNTGSTTAPVLALDLGRDVRPGDELEIGSVRYQVDAIEQQLGFLGYQDLVLSRVGWDG